MLRSAIVVAVLSGSCICAEQLSVDFDPAKTQIHWSLAGNVHSTHGTFHLKQGHVVLDSVTGAISGDLVADASSGDSGNGARDKRMNKEILEADKFREFRFTPQKVEGPVSIGGLSKVRVSGTFLVHGSTHNVTIPISVSFATVPLPGRASSPFLSWTGA